MGGVRAADLGTLNRSDGHNQVTYAGHPLYYYVGDTKPGDTNGQGLDDFGAKWWLLTAAGKSLGATAAGASSGPGSAGGGW
jgi:hypothetical protein